MRSRGSRMEPPTIPMTPIEGASRLQPGPGAKICIVAGGGALPVQVATALAAQGNPPFVVILEGEVGPGSDLEHFEHQVLPLESFGSLVSIAKRHGATHMVLAGEVKRRPRLRGLKLNGGLFAMIPSVITALARGDDGLLKMIVHYIESRGIKVVGAHEIVPELVAAEGLLTKAAPQKADWRDIEAALAAARAIGGLDIGQGAVAVGGRVVALEGIEGTDGLLDRVRELRDHGRMAGKKRGVLVKCAKPGQEERADLPSIGPQTVDAAHAAGLAGIAVEAGRSRVLDGPALVARANALGLFVIGLTAGEMAHGE